MIVLFWSILPHIESFRSSTKRRMETAPLRRGPFSFAAQPTCPCCSSRKWPRHTPKRQQRACSHCPGTTADEAAEVATSDRSCQRADSPRGLRAARLKLSKAYIVEHSHRREISIGSV